jgi:hypothetical protein
VYNVTHFEYSRNVNHHTRCVITCVGADCGRSRGTKIKTYVNDSVLSSLKMEGIRFFFLNSISIYFTKCVYGSCLGLVAPVCM